MKPKEDQQKSMKIKLVNHFENFKLLVSCVEHFSE